MADFDNRIVTIGGVSTVILDKDDTLAGDSDTAVPSQQAVKAYVDGKISVEMSAGSGFAGTGTVYKSSVLREGDLIKTTIYIDLTGTKSIADDLDIIGTHVSNPSHIGQITAAVNGTIVGGLMTCLEVPTTGADDIDLYCATEGTGVVDGDIEALAETALVTAGGAWALGGQKGLSGLPAANKYLYLTAGEAVAGTYDAGKFLIELWGTA